MIAFVVVELLAASPLLSVAMLQAQAEAAPVRRNCFFERLPNSRFTRRVCTGGAAKPAATPLAPRSAEATAAPIMTTLGVGMAVVDSQGGAVGMITAVAADSVTVKTDRHLAQLPKTSLAISDGKALIGLTQAELDASIDRTLAAKADAALKVGTMVKAKDGASVGTIDAVDSASVTIRLSSGPRVSIPRTSIAVDADGNGVISLSAAELDAQLKATQPPR